MAAQDKYARKGLVELSWDNPVTAPEAELRTLSADELNIKWGECLLGIICPCGAELVLTTDTYQDKLCDCGRIYRITQTVQVAEPRTRHG